MKDKIYLVDMDSTIANTGKLFVELWAEKHPDKIQIPQEKIKTFYMENSFPRDCKPLIREIWSSKGFFIDQEPIPGSLEALKDLEEYGDVFLASSPLTGNPTSADEKLEWAEKYLGKNWRKRTILCKDKTLIHGDILIDDKPEITGLRKPSWEHILYEQPWNKDIKERKRLNWKNYKEILKL